MLLENKMFLNYESRFDVLNEKPSEIPVELTQAQAIEDLNQCVYLLETSCVSYIEQREKINFQERYNQVLEELKSRPTVRIEYFLMSLLGKLTDGIKDLHSSFSCEITENNQTRTFVRRFIPKTVVYFSSGYFIKKGKHFISTDNSSMMLDGEIPNQKTKIIEKSQLYFVPVLHNSKNLYKAAKFFTWSFPEEKDFLINGQTVNFSKQNFELESSWKSLQSKYRNSRTNYYFIMPDCSMPWDLQKQHYDILHENMNGIRTKKNLIIDNRWNCGGIPLHQLKFFCELFGYNSNIIDDFINRDIPRDEDILEGKCFLSNPIVQKEIEISEKSGDWKYKSRLLNFYKNELTQLQNGKTRWSDNEDPDGPHHHLGEKTSYKGRIILLVDARTASMGEQLYLTIKEDFGYKNIVLVGTNTCGCMSYGNPYQYYLKNSGITLCLSSRTEAFSSDNFAKEYLEGRGLIPDYWATTDVELEETLDCLCK
ncbi:MAG: hypothetical protein J5710_03560 [Treponema sp.]|nr:hypothetical protein [Treponema sp.]MBR5645190.1 hypothetical protein [Treponema sp.]